MTPERQGVPTREHIAAHVRSSGRGPLKTKEIARGLGVPARLYRALRKRLAAMEREGQLYRVKGNRYAVPETISLVVGRLQVIRSGDAFVVSPQEKQDVFVPAAVLDSAMDGDQVVARVEGRPRGSQPTGRVIKVLERAHPTIVGTYHRDRGYGFVVPHDRRLHRDVFIPPAGALEAEDGDVVVARIRSYGDRKLGPVGEVERVLGLMHDPGVDVLAIIYHHGLPVEFPAAVEEEARARARADPSHDPTRHDRRDLHVFTIDPVDAKDHDDALSVRPAGEGLWEVGIHIADVSHYVEPGGALDLEALGRGTSVYLVDRVIPMLPEALSSGACSLLPGEDRAAVSVFVGLDDEGEVVSHHFERCLVRSRHRLNYEEVEEVLTGTTSVDEPTDEALKALGRLSRKLLDRRASRGSLDFDLPEARVELGEGGEPLDIQRRMRLGSHRLIEEFMLLANTLVGEEAKGRELPLLFRVHEPPPRDRLDPLRRFLSTLGYHLPQKKVGPRHLQKILNRVEGRPEEPLVSTVVLRSMSRARYDAEDLGHFGLALRSYTHFTSPIRRYPDLLAHRVLVRAVVERRPVPEEWFSGGLPAVAERCSARERVAAEAERDSVELKKIEFMKRHLGEDFWGTVSGVTAFGFFVLLEDYFVEGLVHVSALHDDYYELHEEAYALTGSRSGRTFRLGDRVQVQVARVDKEERRIDFVLIEGRALTSSASP
jgi:ribonuclease R